jgi:hypothetical protein
MKQLFSTLRKFGLNQLMHPSFLMLSEKPLQAQVVEADSSIFKYLSAVLLTLFPFLKRRMSGFRSRSQCGISEVKGFKV